MVAEFHFLRPLWLLVLPALVLLWWRLRRSRADAGGWQTACDAHLLPYLLVRRRSRAARWLWILLGLGWLVAVLALAGPTWSRQPQPVFQRLDGRMIVLDLSRSMLAEDLKPSRLGRARFKIADLLKRSDEGQTGLVAFAGDAFVVAPLTRDAATISALLPALEPAIMPVQGSRPERGLRKAAALLKQAGFARGDILLVSDDGGGQSVLATARALLAEGFRISVLAVGSAEGAPIPVQGGGFLEDSAGNLAIARLDGAALRRLAEAGGGYYTELRADDTDLDWLLRGADSPLRIKAERDERQTTLWREQGPWLVLLLVPLAALAFRRGWLLGLLVVPLSGMLGLALPPEARAQEVQAHLERTTILEGETVILVIEATGPLRGAEPDLNPLSRDFQILGNSSSAHIELRGQHQSTTTRWTLELKPRRGGELRIPPLTLGDRQTAALRLLVQPPAADSGRAALEPLFLEVQAQPQEPYVQAQVLFTIRLFYALPILEGALDAPEPADTVVERLGEDRSYETHRQGLSYRVIERRYAIFPEKSGALTIPAVSFRGRIRSDDTGRSPFGLLPAWGQRIQIDAEPVTLQVRPRPAGYSGQHWLPSSRLTLHEQEQDAAAAVRVGEPLTRTLVLEAQGLHATQLPAPALVEPPNARLYPDQPLRENRRDASGIVSRREQRVAIIPSAPGALTLPEIRLTWWDTGRDQERVAVLPARTLTVLPAADTAAPPAPAPGPGKPSSLSGLPRPPAPIPLWPGVSAALLLVWLLTLLAWWRARQGKALMIAADPALNQEAVPASLARRALQRACRANDPRRAARALLDWAAAVWPQSPPANLGALAERLAQGGRAVRALDRALYAPGTPGWDGAALWRAVRKGLTEKGEIPPARADLAPLYPQRL